MAAALSWEAADQRLPSEVEAILGAGSELLLAIPEHKVALPGGSRESQCDVFALVRHGEETLAVSVEAKVNETFGPKVGDWMTNASDGKHRRMAFLCETLGITGTPRTDLRYQLLHRTVAAVVEARRFGTDRAAMVVQSFSQKHRWFGDFQAFAAELGVEVKRGVGVTYELPCGLPLTLGWATGSPEHL